MMTGEGIGRIDAELAEIGALVTCLRLIWENAEEAGIDELREIGVTVAFVIGDKVATAKRCVAAASGGMA